MYFRSPFTCIVSGSTGAGKTEWIKKFIEHREDLISPPPADILYCFGQINPTILQLHKKGVPIFEGVPTREMLVTKRKNLLLILDDLMLSIDVDFLNDLFTRISHNSNISIVFVVQTLFSPSTKVIRQNCHYFVLLRNPEGQKQISILGSQIFPGRLKYFHESYKDATSKLFSYLVIDLHPQSDEEERLVTNIFPGEELTYYLLI